MLHESEFNLTGSYLVQLPQVLLLLLVHDDVDAGDRLADDADLGELGGRAAGDLGHAEGGELGLELVELLGQLLLLLGAKLAALDLALEGGNHKLGSLTFSRHMGLTTEVR